MKRYAFGRLHAVCLGFALVTGVEAKALGIAACPMHQAAAGDARHQAHHEHQDHSPGTVACDCLDACQAGGQLAIAVTGGPERSLPTLVDVRLERDDVERSGPTAVRAHVLPFATAPPSLS